MCPQEPSQGFFSKVFCGVCECNFSSGFAEIGVKLTRVTKWAEPQRRKLSLLDFEQTYSFDVLIPDSYVSAWTIRGKLNSQGDIVLYNSERSFLVDVKINDANIPQFFLNFRYI